MPLSVIKAEDTSVLTEISQQIKKQVSGVIRDEKGEAIIGANVIERNASGNGTVTDIDGKFALNVFENATILISYVGYLPQEISVARKTYIEVILKEDTKTLNEVVVVGYGTQSRETITTSVSSLNSKVLEYIPYSNAASALQGGIAGLTVQSYSGQPGLAPRIILRGGTSINNPNGSTPLYIVDGIIRPNMDDIPANDISSIQVLKDAAATSIYGARASNGVVLITTKSGREGPVKISFSYDFSVANENKEIELVNARDYIIGARQSIMWIGQKDPANLAKLNQATGYGTGNDLTNNTAYTTQYLTEENKHKLNEGWESVQDPFDPSKTIIFKDTNFQKLRKRTAYSHNYNISASGGSEKSLYSISLGYLDAQGTALNSDYKRLSYNMNGTLKILSNLAVNGKMMFTNVDDNRVYGNPDEMWTTMINTFVRSAALPSTAKLTFEDGSYAPGLNSSFGNPLYYQVGPHSLQKKNNSSTLTIGVGSSWEIIKGLTLDLSASLFETNVRYRQFQPGYLSGITSFNTTRNVGAYNSNNRHWQAGSILTYFNNIGLHNFEAKLGYEYYTKKYWTVNAYGKGASTDLIPTLNAAAEPTSVGGWESEFVTEGLFSRINYNFDERYLLTFNFRYDGASNLGANSRTGFFPGISAGWNIHKENFWKNVVPEGQVQLKLRGSYGENGNIQGLGDYQAQGLYAVGSEYFGGAAIQPSVIPNANLKWERSRTTNLGIDLGLFNHRINLLVDVYNRITNDLLTNVSLPGSSGFGTVLTNNGSLGNKGLEVSLDAHILNPTSPFQWKSSFNISKVKTRILKLPDNGVEKNRQGGSQIYDPKVGELVWVGGLQEGGRIGDILAYYLEGVYATDEEAASAPLDHGIGQEDKRKFGGDAIWRDFDGNGIIDSYDRYIIGNRYPTITGGFLNDFSYKNISLSIRTDFTLGHTINNYGRRHLDGQLQGDIMPTKEYYEKSWKKQGDITDTPRYIWQNQQGNLRESQLYIEKGDFLALREITLAYLVPNRITQKLKLSNLRINITGSNLHYFTNYSGLNPEDGGMDYGRYPNPRTITFGLRASF
ncbi:TonB-dependent receptor [Proteiniphilum sp. X52]|nr:TonB-dependent receptor [Proteiniphilum sp. X52]